MLLNCAAVGAGGFCGRGASLSDGADPVPAKRQSAISHAADQCFGSDFNRNDRKDGGLY